MSISNNKTSHLIAGQVPQFVRDDHTTFVQFLEDYYKFLEQEGQLSDVTKKHMQDIDIDLTNESYRERFFKNFLKK